MKKLKFMLAAAAIGLTTASQAGDLFGSTSFEDLAVGLAPTNGLFKFEGAADDNESEIVGESVSFAGERPYKYQDTPDSKYLKVSTGEDPLLRKVDESPYDVGSDGALFIDTLVQFTVTPADGPVATNASGKLLIYLKEDGLGNTNLMVRAARVATEFVDHAEVETITPDDILVTNGVVAGKWYRLTVKANVVDTDLLTFNIWLDGVQLKSATALYGDDKAAFPSLLGRSSTQLAAVGFAGEGDVDDLAMTTVNPFDPAIDFTLAWPAGMSAVSYKIGAGSTSNIAAEATSPLTIHPGYGKTVYFTFANADGVQKTLSDRAGDDQGQKRGLDASDATFVWDDYLGEAVDGAYTIDDLDDFYMFGKGVASGLATTNVTFKQTADIDMYGEAEFSGIGTYNESDPMGGVPFSGTYDGQNHKIANVTMKARNYGGVFNQVGGGTIKNLTVEDIYFLSGGFAIVGNLGGDGAVLQNLTAAGSFGDAGMPGTHNMAGIVVRACGGGETGALVKDCTNNAAIYGSYTKLGGICAITQRKLTGAGVTFDGCVNNGALNLSRTSTGVTGFAGIVGYESEPIVLVGCSNTGSLNNTASGANTDCNGQLVGYAYNQSLTDNGGNSAPSNAKMVGKYGTSTVTGFKYARVDNGVATTIAPPYTLAAGSTYLLEGNVAASETPVFTLAADGDTIAFDTALGYTFAGTVAPADEYLTVSDATVGTVTTYTAVLPKYRITFLHGEGTSTYSINVAAGTIPIPPTPAEVTGKRFSYWDPEIAVAVSNTAYWARYELAGEDVEPGEQSSTTYDSAEAATNALANVTIAASDAVTNALDSAAQETYLAKFEKKVVETSPGSGEYKVEVGLTAAAVTELVDEATTNVAAAVAAALPEIVGESAATNITLTCAEPGFYYSVGYATTLDGDYDAGEGERRLAGSNGEVQLQIPAKDPTATSGFYKVMINVVPKPVTP